MTHTIAPRIQQFVVDFFSRHLASAQGGSIHKFSRPIFGPVIYPGNWKSTADGHLQTMFHSGHLNIWIPLWHLWSQWVSGKTMKNLFATPFYRLVIDFPAHSSQHTTSSSYRVSGDIIFLRSSDIVIASPASHAGNGKSTIKISIERWYRFQCMFYLKQSAKGHWCWSVPWKSLIFRRSIWTFPN